MKSKKEARNLQSKAARRIPRPNVDAPPMAAPPSSLSCPLLTGEALELKVADKMCEGFRTSDARKALREACGGAEDSAIEAAVVSPRVKGVVEPVARAFALEQSVTVIRLLLTNARLALEADKPTPAQILALKIVFETFVEKIMAGIGGGLWQEAFSLLGFSDREKTLIENLIQLERGQRPPVPEALHAAADPAEFAGTGA